MMATGGALDKSAEIENTHDNNLNHQDDESQWENGQLGTNWFSPPTTSTQIVSFDLISLDETQELIDLSDEALFNDSALFADETIISETPPPQDESSNWGNSTLTNYLFQQSTKSCEAPKTSHEKSSKRRSSQKSKRPLKIMKMEGYMCKLNGGIYQVAKRDFDVLEAIEKGLKSIRDKIEKHNGLCNVRLLCLQLNQIETVLGLLDDDFLELTLPQEVWDEMMLHTKSTFRDVQDQVDLCRKKKLEIDDDLAASFNHSLNISVGKPAVQQNLKQQSKKFARKPRKDKGVKKNEDSSNLETQVVAPVVDDAEKDEREIEIVGSSQLSTGQPLILRSLNNIPENSENKLIPFKKSEPRKDGRGRPRVNKNNKLKFTKKNPTEPQKGLQKNSLSLSDDQEGVITEEDLNEPFTEHSVIPGSTACSSQETTTESSYQQTNGNSEILALANTSTFILENSIQPPRTISDSQVTDIMNATSATQILGLNSSQLEEEIFIEDHVKAPSGHNESSVSGSQNLSSQLSERKSKLMKDDKLRRLSKMATMNFSLKPFILKGVLSPGKGNLKMNFNNRVYIASLAVDGTIEMNGFTFPSIGYWIKSVEGKRFGQFLAADQKTLDLLYNGKPLEDLVDLKEQSQKAVVPKKKYKEIPLTPVPKLNTRSKSTAAGKSAVEVLTNATVSITEFRNFEDLQLVPDEMTRHIKTIFLHTPDEYFPICQCVEQFWNGTQPFPQHLLDEVDSW